MFRDRRGLTRPHVFAATSGVESDPREPCRSGLRAWLRRCGTSDAGQSAAARL